MLVLSKLTNINHANGGSYDPPLFLYSALFAARGRFGGASPHGGGFWRGFPARRRTLAGFPRPAALWRVAPHGGGLLRVALPGGALAGLPRPAANFGGASPHSGGLWWVAPHGFLCRRGTFGLGRAIFSLFFAYAPGIRQKHPQKFCRLHCRISYCIGKFKKFVKINE